MSNLTQSPAWRALAEHRESMAHTSIGDLFAQDSERSERFSLEAAGIYVDYSESLITTGTLDLLSALARQAGVEERRRAMFEAVSSGDRERNHPAGCSERPRQFHQRSDQSLQAAAQAAG